MLNYCFALLLLRQEEPVLKLPPFIAGSAARAAKLRYLAGHAMSKKAFLKGLTSISFTEYEVDGRHVLIDEKMRPMIFQRLVQQLGDDLASGKVKLGTDAICRPSEGGLAAAVVDVIGLLSHTRSTFDPTCTNGRFRVNCSATISHKDSPRELTINLGINGEGVHPEELASHALVFKAAESSTIEEDEVSMLSFVAGATFLSPFGTVDEGVEAAETYGRLQSQWQKKKKGVDSLLREIILASLAKQGANTIAEGLENTKEHYSHKIGPNRDFENREDFDKFFDPANPFQVNISIDLFFVPLMNGKNMLGGATTSDGKSFPVIDGYSAYKFTIPIGKGARPPQTDKR